MKIAVMQPYFLPYIGYYQLMNAADEFIIYDNIEYTKKGWINRNRILVNGKDDFISIPLKKDSDFLFVNQRKLSDSWPADSTKLLNRIKESYRKAPHFNTVYPLFEEIIKFPDPNLFAFLLNSLKVTKDYLNISTKLIVSSNLTIDHTLKSEAKVIALCANKGAKVYINPIGGLELYGRENFEKNGIKLNFLKSSPFVYQQFQNEFVPWLSILDVMMFKPVNEIKKYLDNEYTLV